MKIEATLARVPSRLAFWALAGVALFLGHDAVYAVQIGPGESLTRVLREAGHDYWGLASLALGLVGLAAGFGVLARLRHLRQRASGIGANVKRPRWSRLPATWLRLFAVVCAGFLLQENIEHAVTHMHAPGLGALLGPEYPLALPVIALITGLAALLATAIGGMEREMLVAIAVALGRAFRNPRLSLPRPPLRIAARRLSPLALSMAGRAPPVVFVQHS
ncbi:MAG: hypothetical protein LC798_17295 [Chloroflexi bacterium]|nr:hypothetical protein [Chloroflexota bacterium]